MRDKLAESRGVNAAIVAVTLLFAACTEHELATVAPASLQPSTDPVPATSEEYLANAALLPSASPTAVLTSNAGSSIYHWRRHCVWG
jgi:hypothetical protein